MLLSTGVSSCGKCMRVSGCICTERERERETHTSSCVRVSARRPHSRAHSHYLIYKTLVVVGRKPSEGAPKGADVDVDLALEGQAGHVSRQQAIIRRDVRGVWWLENVGKCTVHVNSRYHGMLALPFVLSDFGYNTALVLPIVESGCISEPGQRQVFICPAAGI